MNARATIEHERPAASRAGAPTVVRAGFIPLLDCAALAVAAEKGFAAAEGIRLELIRETSWANIRDRVAIGHFDAAQMLAPMPIASSLGIGHLTVPMIAPMALGLGGNAVTVSPAIWDAMVEAGADGNGDPRVNGLALKRAVAARKAAGAPPPTFGMVYPFSCHNYELRYWLAANGIRPDRDVRLAVIPPPFMVDALRAGHVDGFCVGEPWNSLAVAAGVGVIATTKAQIWRLSPEKVLGLRAAWAEQHPERLAALIRAVFAAAGWCDDPANQAELAHLLAGPSYLDCPASVLRRGLSGTLDRPRPATAPIPEFLVFRRKAATFPWISHAAWLFSQMVRWGQIAGGSDAAERARRCYRPDIYRAALKGVDTAMPGANAKVEGALAQETPVGSSNGRLVLGPDGFFDGVPFDPDRLAPYIDSFGIRTEPGAEAADAGDAA